MRRYLARRAIASVVLVFAVASAAQILTSLAPGDYATDIFGTTSSSEAALRVRTQHGLDQPVMVRYASWLSRVVRLDFGRSMAYDRPVADLIPERAANTAVLAVVSVLVATAIGIPFGVLAATRRGFLATIIRVASLLLVSTPPMLTGIFLVYLAARTGWLPVGGMVTSSHAASTLDFLRHLIVPVLALSLPLAATFERLHARAMTEAIGEPFVLAALSRGIPRRRVLWRSALRVALRPFAAVFGISMGSLLSGSFAVEMVTAWPGLGRLMLDALRARDAFLVAGCATAGAVFLAGSTLIADTLLAWADPRVREP